MVRLTEVLALPSLALTPIAVEDAAVQIRWVATSELADPTPFLDRGEVLLTTGLNTSRWKAEWGPYTRRLAQSGIVALGFGIGLTHDEVPPALIAAAGAAGLSLFSVPRSTPFIAISQAVAELLSAADRADLQSALAMQRDLTRAAVRPDRVQAILDVLAGAVGGGAAVVAPDGDPIALSPGSDRLQQELLGAAAQIDRLRPAGLRASLADIGPAGSTLIQPLGLRGTPDRYLVVAAPGELGGAQRSAITTAVALLSLDAETRSERHEIDRRLRSGAIALILGGQASAARTLLSIGANGTAVDELPARVQVVRAAGPAERLERALDWLDRATDAPGAPIVSALVSGTPPDPTELVSIAKAGGSRVEQIERALGEAGLWVGTGRVVDLADAADSDATAAQALAQAGSFRPLVRWSELVGRGVTGVLNAPSAAVFSAELLGPLARDDREGLLETVRVFLTHHGQRKTTAVALGLHRNTLAHRITRIEGLLGRSLADPQTRVDLWVAIQIRDAWERSPRTEKAAD